MDQILTIVASFLPFVVPLIIGVIMGLPLGKYQRYAFLATLSEKVFWAVEQAAENSNMKAGAKLAMALQEISDAMGRSMTKKEVDKATKVLAKKAKAVKKIEGVHELQK